MLTLPTSKKSNAVQIRYHSKQLEARQEFYGCRYFIFEAGRRTGKTRFLRGITYELVIVGANTVEYDIEAPSKIILSMPELKRAKDTHWEALKAFLGKLNIIDKIDNTALKITFKEIYTNLGYNRPPDLVLAGADKGGNKIRSSRIFAFMADEFQDFPFKMWEESVRPALTDTPGSRALFIGTPKGKTSVLAKLKRDYLQKANWRYFHAKTIDNPYVPRDEIELARQELDPRTFRQEFEASEEDFPGKYYPSFDLTKHVLKYDPDKVYIAHFLAIDPGDVTCSIHVVGIDPNYVADILVAHQLGDNSTAIPGNLIYETIAKYCKEFNVNRVYSPPDRPQYIYEIRKQGKEENISGMKKCVVAFNKVAMGNTYVNTLFNCNRLFLRLKYDIQPEKLKFEDELSSYRRKVKDGVVIDEPEPNQTKHRTDANRYNLATLVKRSVLKIRSLEI